MTQPSLKLPLQSTSLDVWANKYQLKDLRENPVDLTVDDTYRRVAKALADIEPDNKDKFEAEFYDAFQNGAICAGRIMSNAGAEEYKPNVSLINCTVSEIIEDSIEGIMRGNSQSGITLSAGCGIGYEFSTIRPSGAYVAGAGAYTTGPLPFMDIYDKMCFTISSAGGRRGAQMGTFADWHPDVEEFITVKREDGRLRQFNLSVLISDAFMEAVKADADWDLYFPIKENSIDHNGVWKDIMWDRAYCEKEGYILDGDKILVKIYKTIKAKDLWNKIMRSTYDYAEPGFLLIDRINEENNNHFCEKIRATNPCGEQPLPPEGSCLLGSLDLTAFVIDPLTPNARFDWERYKKVVKIFSRMLDNVVEINGLPLPEQRREIEMKRRHGAGFTGVGSAMTLLGMKYGSPESLDFAEEASKVLAIESFRAGAELAAEKGCAPILEDDANFEAWFNSPYIQRLCDADADLKAALLANKCRYTHATSIAPTGTISLSFANNVSNGIEPTFALSYTRNVIVEGKNSKEAVEVYSYEALVAKELGKSTEGFSVTDNVTPEQHVAIQAVAQKWIDSSISKTVNVPTDMPYDEFQSLYIKGYESGLKGMTTFRFNPEAFQGVLVKEEDLANTFYEFTTEDGSVHKVSGDTIIDYDGEEHTAANLFDALKEGYYGKF